MQLHCASADAVDGDRARNLAQKGLAWDALAEAAEYHGLAPILYHTLDSACPELIPENVARRLHDCYRDSAKRNVLLTARLFALLDAFEAKSIAVVPLKGPLLAELLYPDPVLRPFSDLDLLIGEHDVPGALDLLEQEGYRLALHLARLPLRSLRRLGGELILRSDSGGQVDLKWETAPFDYPFRFDVQVLWRSLRPGRIAGREVAALAPDCLMLFLCVHGTKHMWSRLQWLGDVARLAQTGPHWNAVMALAAETCCERPVLLGLLLAHDLLDAPVPDDIQERARADRAVVSHARIVAERLYRAEPYEPSSIQLTAFNASLAEHSWHKVRHYAALLKAPTEAELEVITMPSQLFFLYYPLRAVRMLWKYFARLGSKR